MLRPAVLWLMAFPALVGLMHGFHLWRGERLLPALGAWAIAWAGNYAVYWSLMPR